MRLDTRPASAADVRGTFTLILYGGRYHDDIERVAFFDCEGDRYAFEPYAPAFDFRAIPGLGASEALREAEAFVSRHNAFSRSFLSKIIGPHNRILGFELVPIYRVFSTGIPNPVETNYYLEGGSVVIKVRLQPLADPFRSEGG